METTTYVTFKVKNKPTPIWYAFSFSVLLLFLQSMNAWFTWTMNPAAVSVFCTVMGVIYIRLKEPNYTLLEPRYLVPILLLIIAWLFITDGNGLAGIVNSILLILPIVLIIPLSDTTKINLLKFVTDSMAIILFLSLCVWALLLAHIGVPSIGRVANKAWEYYKYDNHIFQIHNALIYDRRFNAIFLEPGHIGMIASFLLFANKFEVKRKSVAVILVAVLFTLSLAAYVLVIVSFTMNVVLKSQKVFGYIVLWLIMMASGYFFFSNYNGGRNVINELIISRLQYDDTQEDVVGNNRFSMKFDNYYSHFIRTDDAYLGIGNARYLAQDFGPNAGFKVFMVKYGFVGLALTFLFYLSVLLYNNSKLGLSLLVVYGIAFVQRAYPYWSAELLIFIFAMAVGRAKGMPLWIVKTTDEK